MTMPSGYGPSETAAVAREYAAARGGAAVVDLAERGVLAVSGPHRQRLLHNVLSNDIQGREPGRGCGAALMTVKGHLLALMRVLVTPDAVLLEMPADRLAVVEQTLLHYKVGAPVRFAVRPTAILGLLGPQQRAVLGRAGCEIPELAPESHVRATLAGLEALVARAGDLPAGGIVLHLAPEAAGTAWQTLLAAGAAPLGRLALDALRIEEGRAWYGPDITDENLLHETGLLAEYHSFTKGCYVGQEVVARLEARGGHVSRKLRGLRLSAPATPAAPLIAEGKEVGRVTTAAVSPRLGPIAMAYVHRSRIEPGATVGVAGAEATIVELPFKG